jgi:hypothetical protein
VAELKKVTANFSDGYLSAVPMLDGGLQSSPPREPFVQFNVHLGKSWEATMERRAFLKLLFIGVGAAAVAAAVPADAFTSLAPLAQPDRNLDLAPRPGVAASEDMDGAKSTKRIIITPTIVIGVAFTDVIGVVVTITDRCEKTAVRSGQRHGHRGLLLGEGGHHSTPAS